MAKVTRREFLTVLGVAAGGGMLAYAPDAAVKAFEAAWGEDWVEVPGGPESRVASLCRQCPGGCGIQVRLTGGRPVKIEGNPLHPVNRGRLCPKGQTGLLALNDPDRIKGPLQRVGERGAGKWREITWEEAVRIAANRLLEIRAKGFAHKLAVMDGDAGSLTRMLLERFARQFGSPNYIDVPTGLDYGTADAFYLMQGVKAGVVYDMAMANYIVSFGSDLLQSFWSPVQVMNAIGYARRGKDARAKIVQAESRYSITAAKADEWIPIKPGTEGVLALGMANFIIREGLYDREFVQRRAFGFEDWRDRTGTEHQGYKTLVLQNYSPGAVAEITGVPVESILNAAREFATRGPALAVGGGGDVYQQMAVHSLNALAGNIGRPGGVLTIENSPSLVLPAPESDGTARRGLQMPPIAGGGERFPLSHSSLSRFPEGILQGRPYDVDTLFIHHCNPLFSHRHIENLPQALTRVPFIVSFSPYLDETTLNADLVLPDHTPLEKWQAGLACTFHGFPVVGIGRPAVAPRRNTKDAGEAVMEMARAMGNPLAKAFPWKDSQEVLSAVMQKIYEMNAGDLFAPELEETLLRELARRGWRAPGYQNFAEFWEGAQEKGGWWDPAYSPAERETAFRTPSGKFEFYSQTLKEHLEKRGFLRDAGLKTLRDAGIEAGGDRLFLPHWEPKANAAPGSEEAYPFLLKVFQPLVFAGSLHANDPYLQDLSGLYTGQKWHSWVEINPEAAEKLDIGDGDWVWLESPSAKLRFRARLTVGAMPGVASIPLGLGHEASGRWAKGIGENAARLMTSHSEPFTGDPLLHKTRVRIYKARL